MSGNYIYRHHVEPSVKLHRRINPSQSHYDTLTWPEQQVRPRMWCLNAAWTIMGISGRKTSRFENMVWGAVAEKTNDIQAWLLVARDTERHVRSSATKRKTKVDDRKTEGIARYLLHWSSRCGVQRNFWTCAETFGSSGASSNALHDQENKVQGNLSHSWYLQDKSTHASLKPTNLRESVWKELCIKIMKTTLLEKEWIHWVITILCTNLFLCLKSL